MLFYTIIRTNISRILALVAMTLLLAGCPSLTQQQVDDHAATEPSSHYLQLMQQSYGSEKTDWQLLAIRALLREGDLPAVAAQLKSLPKDLNQNQQLEVLLATAELQLGQRNPKLATVTLKKLEPLALNKQQLTRYYQLQLNLAQQKKDPLGQLRAYAALEPLITDQIARQSLVDEIWNTLSSLSVKSMNGMVINANEDTLRGWLDLARIYQTYKNSISELQTEVKNWQTRYPDNLLTQIVPTQLSGVAKFQTINVNRVALLLPMDDQTKPFSEPIRAGFAAAMALNNATNTELELFDTSSRPIADILKEISQNPSTMIVGPLLKKDVELAAQANTGLNILALNKPESVTFKANMCYFGLSPEDEAAEAARFIAKNNKRTPLLIAPRSNFGKRVGVAFNTEWQAAGGQAAQIQYFDTYEDLKEAINSGAGIKVVGEAIDPTQPIPTDKIDAIYIVATQSELTLIKAMLDMEVTSRNRASLYASSRSNQATTGPDFRLEMDGLQFSEIPLLAGSNNKIMQKALQDFNNDYSQVRLFALGMDAWRVANSLAEMRQLPEFKIDGFTGTLSSDRSCVINRQLTWLEFRQGRLNVIK